MKRALSLVLAVVMVFSLALGVVAADTARAALADSGTDSGPVDSGAVYTITFTLNYGTAPVSKTAETDAEGKVTCPFTEDELVRAGYTFDGWYDRQYDQGGQKVDLNTKVFESSVTLYAHWNEIEVPDGMNKEDISIEGAPEGATLTITDQGLTNTETSVREEIAKLPNVEIAPESPVVIYDISLDQSGGNVTITLPVPKGLDASKTIMALHFAKDGAEAFTVKIVDGKMQFTVDSFSEFAFFNADEAAAVDSYKVVIEPSQHGVLDVQAMKDGVGGKYLPVGETVTVPAEDVTGTNTYGNGLAIAWESESGWEIDTITATTSDGDVETVYSSTSRGGGPLIYKLTGDVTFKATFKERETPAPSRTEWYTLVNDPYEYPVKTGEYAPGEISSELEFWYQNTATGEERQLTPATFEIISSEYADMFEVKDGKLVNKTAVPGTEHTYYIGFKITYDGKEYTSGYNSDGAYVDASASIYISDENKIWVGFERVVAKNLSTYMGTQAHGHKGDTFKSFKDQFTGDIPQMYPGVTAEGKTVTHEPLYWFTSMDGAEKWTDNTIINDYDYAYLIFSNYNVDAGIEGGEDPDPQPPVVNPGGGSSGGGGSGGGGSRLNNKGGAATTPVKGGGNVIKAADLTSKVKKNVGGVVTSVKGQGGTSGTAYTVYSNVPSISPDLLKTANDAAVQAASGSGVTVKSILCFDTVRSGQIIGRMYLNPALNTLTTDIKTGITVGNASVEALFTKWFQNNIVVIDLAHQGSFGMPVEVAVKADLSTLNTNTLRFYNYDASTNVYTLIENSQYFIDTNGYLHFTTAVGGPVIVTDAPLALR